jgi:hypothetical protein
MVIIRRKIKIGVEMQMGHLMGWIDRVDSVVMRGMSTTHKWK